MTNTAIQDVRRLAADLEQFLVDRGYTEHDFTRVAIRQIVERAEQAHESEGELRRTRRHLSLLAEYYSRSPRAAINVERIQALLAAPPLELPHDDGTSTGVIPTAELRELLAVARGVRTGFRAVDLFHAKALLDANETDMWQFVLGVLRVDYDLDTHPISGITYDECERTLELMGADPGLQLTAQAVAEIRAAGFEQWWIGYTDGTESFCGGPPREADPHRNGADPTPSIITALRRDVADLEQRLRAREDELAEERRKNDMLRATGDLDAARQIVAARDAELAELRGQLQSALGVQQQYELELRQFRGATAPQRHDNALASLASMAGNPHADAPVGLQPTAFDTPRPQDAAGDSKQ